MIIYAPQGRSRLVLLFRGPLRICCDTSRGRFGLAPDAEVESVRGTAAEADQMKSAQISEKTECGMHRTLDGVKQQGTECLLCHVQGDPSRWLKPPVNSVPTILAAIWPLL